MIKYFAYGSNMCTGRLRMRVPSANPCCVARLNGHALRFHKRSRDGSAKADAEDTGGNADFVCGVVFSLNEAEKPALDDAEGLGKGYSERTVLLEDDSGRELRAFMYYALDDHKDANLKPYSWYVRFVVDGAKQHGLPEDYVARIEAVKSTEDPNRERDKRKRSIHC